MRRAMTEDLDRAGRDETNGGTVDNRRFKGAHRLKDERANVRARSAEKVSSPVHTETIRANDIREGEKGKRGEKRGGTSG